MNTKEKFLLQLNKFKPKGLNKISLSAMSDLSSAISEMQSYDLEGDYDKASNAYEEAISLMEQAKRAADKYIPLYSDFEKNAYDQWEAYQKASKEYLEISSQLYDLGVDESPELAQYGNALADGETTGQKAFEQTQSEFGDHNELVDISSFN
jgi:tetratricopeptide (TPR) repeat protein|tara:strand:+ start:195 stop:650 length:456 start_codon:yes stop_codon:yes gene_type:complete